MSAELAATSASASSGQTLLPISRIWSALLIGDLVVRRAIFRIRDRGFKHMVVGVACFELKNVQKLIHRQPRFLLELSTSSLNNGFATFDLAARQSPPRLGFANEQDASVFLANDCSSDFHFLIRKTVSNKNLIFANHRTTSPVFRA